MPVTQILNCNFIQIRRDICCIAAKSCGDNIIDNIIKTGIDARLITDANMRKLAEIPIRPVRIAFDHWELHEIYEKAVRTAVRNGHRNLSNYILYNFEDRRKCSPPLVS